MIRIEIMNKLAAKIFSYRSYTPIPFLIVMVIFQEATWQSLLIGFAVALLGEFFRLWGVSYAGSETRTTGSVGGTYLVVSGPFAHLRNPLYLGNILLYVGIGVMSMALFPYLQIVALVFFVIQYHFIIKEEEGYLRKTFGKEYEDFYNNVPRLIPQFKAYKNGNLEQPKYNLGAGLRSERRTLQAFSLVTIIIVALWAVKYFG